MALAVQGIKVPSITISRNNEDGSNQISGSYELISITDHVLCNQPFNGYSGMKIAWSNETIIALNAFLATVKKDVQTTIGIT